MRRFRFHLGTLVIFILLSSVGLAALRESNDIWDSNIFTLTLGVLLASILLAIHRAEKRRAFWIGFALFGSAYLALSLWGQGMLWDAATGKLLGGWSGTTENFVRIGHSLFALLAGWLGGQLSRLLTTDINLN